MENKDLYKTILDKINISSKHGYSFEFADLNDTDISNFTPLMYAFKYNISEYVNLNTHELDYLIKNSDLKVLSNQKENALIFALHYNNRQKLNLTEDQWSYLINNSDLSVRDHSGWTALMYAFGYFSSLPQPYLDKLIDNCNLIACDLDCNDSITTSVDAGAFELSKKIIYRLMTIHNIKFEYNYFARFRSGGVKQPTIDKVKFLISEVEAQITQEKINAAVDKNSSQNKLKI